MEFRVRDFRSEDFDTLWSLDQSCFAPGISYSRLELATYMRRRGSFTLVGEVVETQAPGPARRAGQPLSGIVGFIVAEAGRRETGHVITIDVLAAARRFGVGSMLLGAAEKRLRAVHCRTIGLETAIDNQSALAFYKRHGFFLVRTIPRYYSNGMDAFVLQKDLPSPGEGSQVAE